MLAQSSFYWVLYYAGTMFSANRAHATTTACQVYPSEYAYKVNSVTEQESIIANCRRYPGGLQENAITSDYIHCDGTQLKLVDSDLGQEQYQTADYYVWLSDSTAQLLFIFPTKVSLTTITLHYYSDSDRGLPRLIFYAVPDDFDVWDAPTATYPQVDVDSVPPGGEPAGRRSVSITVNFNTMKVLMYKFGSVFTFAVSEVEFFTCTPTTISATSYMTTTTTVDSARTTSDSRNVTTDITNTWTSQATAVQSPQTQGALPPAVVVAVGAVGALLLILIVSLIIILSLILWHRKRRGNRKSEIDSNSLSMREDASYSTFERGMRQKVQQQDSNSTELYDQIHLSPFTGQSELISKTETESAEVSIIPNIYSNVDMENSQPQSSSEANKPEDATVIYALVNKKKKKKKSKVASANKDDSTMKENFKIKEKREEEVKAQELPSLEEMYAVVQKKPKKSEEQEETPPPIPPPTVESLYTAVQKKPQ